MLVIWCSLVVQITPERNLQLNQHHINHHRLIRWRLRWKHSCVIVQIMVMYKACLTWHQWLLAHHRKIYPHMRHLYCWPTCCTDLCSEIFTPWTICWSSHIWMFMHSYWDSIVLSWVYTCSNLTYHLRCISSNGYLLYLLKYSLWSRRIRYGIRTCWMVMSSYYSSLSPCS